MTKEFTEIAEMDYPRDALDASIEGARLADPVIDHGDGRKHAFVPERFQLQDISDPHRLPPYIKQSITVNDRASLIGYVNRFSDDRSILIANYEASTITARLDWHSDNQAATELAAQPNVHVATLKIASSLEYARWSEMEGKMHSQEEFAIFIEENVSDIIDPEHATIIEICRDLEATQGAQFKSRTRLENGDLSFKYETETRVTNDVVVPDEITLAIPLYYGEEPTEIRAKFRFRVNGGGLQLGFKWHRVEYQRQAKFQEMAHDAAEQTGRPVFFGAA